MLIVRWCLGPKNAIKNPIGQFQKERSQQKGRSRQKERSQQKEWSQQKERNQRQRAAKMNKRQKGEILGRKCKTQSKRGCIKMMQIE